MKTNLKALTILAAAVAIALVLSALTVRAQQNQFGQPTQLLFPTNSANIAGANVFSISTAFYIQPGPIALTIYATNALTVVTNVLVTVVSTTNISTFVYSAATMGTNFSTNWSGSSFPATATTTAWAIPQQGGTNAVLIK